MAERQLPLKDCRLHEETLNFRTPNSHWISVGSPRWRAEVEAGVDLNAAILTNIMRVKETVKAELIKRSEEKKDEID